MDQKDKASCTAFRDIAKYLFEEYKYVRAGAGDRWFVTREELDTSEARKLNRKLDLHRINHYGKHRRQKKNTHN